MRRTAVVILLAVVLLMTACASYPANTTVAAITTNVQTATPAPTPVPTLNRTSGSLTPGETLRLSVPGSQSVKWTSSDPFVAIVDENGLVTGRHKSGKTIITAETNGIACTCDVTNAVKMRDITAKQMVSEMRIGSNFASALDTIDWDLRLGYDPYPSKQDGLDKWPYYMRKNGTTIPTTDMIRILKDAGYDAVRLTVSWSLYANDQTFEIDDDFFDTVEEYVSAILDNGMYCIINSHYDYLNRSWVGDKWVGDWMRPEYKSYVDARFGAIWKQIAERFQPYDDYLIYESMNEPGMNGDDYVKSTGSDKGLEQMQRDRVNDMNKIFYDTVRKSGGTNAKRTLAISPVGNSAYELQYLDLPQNDSNLIAEVHYYYNNDDGSPVTNWSGRSSKDTKKVDEAFKTIKDYMARSGLPVILGEWGNTAALPMDSRIDQATYIIKQAHMAGIPGFWWECGWYDWEPADQSFAMFDREKLKWVHPELLKAIMESIK